MRGIRPKSLPGGCYVPTKPKKNSKGTALTALSQPEAAETVLSEETDAAAGGASLAWQLRTAALPHGQPAMLTAGSVTR